MTIENRVLAYGKATELKDSDLLNISGGTAKNTLINDVLFTGYSSGSMDIEIAQMLD